MTRPLMLLDTASLYFRAFHGVPDTGRTKAGAATNALRGTLDMIAALITRVRPGGIVACWDVSWRPSWRVALVPSYKAHRVAAGTDPRDSIEDVPDDLAPQIPLIREALSQLSIPVEGVADHEADDVIGTLASRARTAVDIVTGDRDLFQLIDDDRGIRVVYTGRGMRKLEDVTGAVLRATYGVRADQYADFATLRGDASDGLPGVPGIGDKTAAALLSAHGDLDTLRGAPSGPGGPTPRLRAALDAAADYLDRAPAVVRVVRDLPLADPPSDRAPLSAADRERALTWARSAGAESAMTRCLNALDAAEG